VIELRRQFINPLFLRPDRANCQDHTMSKHTGQPSRDPFGFPDFLIRLAASLVLVLITYNPSGYSYAHWVYGNFTGEGLQAVHYFLGMVLLACWSVLIISTERSLGAFGTVIGALLIGTGIWFLMDIGLIHAETTSGIGWLVLIALGILLAIGLSWAHIRRRLSGQLEVDTE
jgi:hypothetical protein